MIIDHMKAMVKTIIVFELIMVIEAKLVEVQVRIHHDDDNENDDHDDEDDDDDRGNDDDHDDQDNDDDHDDNWWVLRLDSISYAWSVVMMIHW